MGKRNKKWVIKNEEGLIKGPFSTEKVLTLISLGDFTGTELISEYPGSDWFPISQDPEFYDHLLDVLTQQNPEKEVAVNIISNVKNDLSFRENDSSHLNNADLKLGIKESKREPDQNQYQPSVSQTILRPVPETPLSKNAKKKTKKDQKSSLSSNDIELLDVKKQLRWEKLKSSYKPILFGTVILFLGVYFAFFSEEDQGSDERIHLLIPKQQTSSLPGDQIKNIYSKALAAYSMDTFSKYQMAQNQLVSIIEGSSRAVEAMSLLCLTYYELWPFAFQDSMDIKALSHLTQRISGIDKGGVHSATCKTVDLILKGRYSEAQSLSGSTLETLTSSGQPPVVFYYFMAIMADFSGDLKTAIGYLASAQQLWPQWLKPFVYQAQLYVRVENYSQAANIYRSILKVNSQHIGSKIELGLLEYKYFRNLTLGEALLRDGIKQPEKISKKILSRGFFGLAEIFLQKHNQSESLYYAKKAFSIDSTNSLAKNLVVQLGGTKELSRTRFKSYQLIAEGDQFYREGDCNSAQAHYKAAFEIDKKSAVGAMKAGECLWKLGLSTEAIDWMNKAIRADVKLIEAYVTLSDYYSQRYNFNAAAQVLLSAKKEAPKSYEVFRGFASIELRRQNPKAAIEYAKQSLAIYDTDVESHVVIAEAYLLVGESRQAYAHASRAAELDVNHRRAQIIFGRSLGGVQGPEVAISFLGELVKKYPIVSEYRMALGKQLMEDERYADAERVFYEVTQIEEKSKEAYLQLGKALLRQKLFERAQDAFMRAAVLDPSDSDPLFESGLLFLDINKPNEAKVQFERVLKINKLYPLVHYQLGKAELMLQNAELALEQAREEKKVNPNLADAYLLAAEAYTQMKQYSACVGEYQKAIKLRPQSSKIYLDMAQCYRKSDQLDIAIAMLNQAATKESGAPQIYRELGIIYEIKGDLVNAIAAYKQYFVLDPNASDRSAIEGRLMSRGQQ